MIGIIYNELYIRRCVNNSIRYRDSVIRCIIYVVMWTMLLMCVYEGEFTRSIIMYYSIWLLQLAYVDYYTGYVYDRMVYCGIIPVIACIVHICNNYWDNVVHIMLAMLVTIFIVIIAGLTKCIGDGDEEVLTIGVVINTMWIIENKHVFISDIIIINLAVIYIGIVLFVIRYCRRIVWKRFRFDRAYPFLPSMFMSLVIFLYIIY